MPAFRIFLIVACSVVFILPGFSQVPEWIWHPNDGKAPQENEVRFFRKSFEATDDIRKATLSATADDESIVYLNGEVIGRTTGWNKALHRDVTKKIHPGTNILAVRGRNTSGDAAIILRLTLDLRNGSSRSLITDGSWLAAAKADEGWTNPNQPQTGWVAAVSKGKLGVQPWGDALAPAAATPASQLTAANGFKVELIRSAEPGEGSWVAMAVDPQGRLIVSPQGSEPMLRITLQNGKVDRIEPLDVSITGAMGLLYAHDSLYVNGQGPDGYHLYRLRSTDRGEHFARPELLRKWNGNKGGTGEHGAHAIVLGPDKKLYVVCGNFVDVPEDVSPASPHRNYADDHALPRAEDGNGFGAGRKPPGGFVLRMDPDGKNAELFASGQRNTYDIGFNEDGELFGFDSDMEWDWGMPWYRPIRIYHIVSGADHGFREGSGKWPEYYQDSLPSAVPIGIGSPTGVKFGTTSRFPDKYRRAMFAMDWSYGRILAVHLEPRGATYAGTFENFVAPKSLTGNGPKSTLNVTDMEFGPDGALYFTTGGRGTQSGLYRVASQENNSEKRTNPGAPASKARQLRQQLEAFHGKTNPRAVAFAWPHLNSDDRWIRYAARIALESQPLQEWKSRALEEKKTLSGLTALLALARLGGKDSQNETWLALKKFPLDSLTEEQQLLKLRVIEVSLARSGMPEAALRKMALEKLDAHYPAKSWPLNRELSQLLVAFESPTAIEKTLTLLKSAPTQEEQIHYLFTLRHLKTNWTMEQRREYFTILNDRIQASQNSKLSEPHYPGTVGAPMPISTQHPAQTMKWFADTGQSFRDGASFPKFLQNCRRDAIASLSDNERGELAALISGQSTTPQLPAPRQRAFVKEWKVQDLSADLNQAARGRNFERGRQAYVDAQCMLCHVFDKQGGSIGPDLTAVASRFSRKDILDSIIEPSKVVSEQYQNMTLTLKNGDEVTGRILEENTAKVTIMTEPIKQLKTDVSKGDIAKRDAARLSPMPEALVNVLSKDEILDLIAYLASGGKRDHPSFRPR